MNRERVKAAIRKWEGFAEKGYEDNGQLSGGYGHKLPESWPKDWPVTREQAEDWLDEDVGIAVATVARIYNLPEDVAEARHEALVDIAYNIGEPRLRGFRKANGAVNAGDWVTAAREFTDSKWYGQVGKRAVQNVYQIETGRFA